MTTQVLAGCDSNSALQSDVSHFDRFELPFNTGFSEAVLQLETLIQLERLVGDLSQGQGDDDLARQIDEVFVYKGNRQHWQTADWVAALREVTETRVDIWQQRTEMVKFFYVYKRWFPTEADYEEWMLRYFDDVAHLFGDDELIELEIAIERELEEYRAQEGNLAEGIPGPEVTEARFYDAWFAELSASPPAVRAVFPRCIESAQPEEPTTLPVSFGQKLLRDQAGQVSRACRVIHEYAQANQLTLAPTTVEAIRNCAVEIAHLESEAWAGSLYSYLSVEKLNISVDEIGPRSRYLRGLFMLSEKVYDDLNIEVEPTEPKPPLLPTIVPAAPFLSGFVRRKLGSQRACERSHGK